MEKENMTQPNWASSTFGMDIQPNELNYAPDQLTNCFFNPNWDNSVDQSDPFESALSSIVSSPAASNAGAIPGGGGDGLMIRELIGRLGSICNSGDISPQNYIAGHNNNNNSTNTSCYSTPLNSPPKLNLSMMDSQIRGNLPIPGNHPSLAPFSPDPGFAERAARFSCFVSNTSCMGLNETELPYRLMPRVESGKLSRAASYQSLKLATGSQMGVQENNRSSPQEANLAADKKLSRLSRSSTPENTELGDSREGSSVSEQIPGGEVSNKVDTETNGRKRKSIPRGKAKETLGLTTPSAKDSKAALDNDESKAKRSKQDEDAGNEKDTAKGKTQPKTAGDVNQKQNKDNSKPPEPPKDYIHVRARRGQATDSHSLAERVRREKISERMKFLQDLVPGCNKVTGKAVMLDEIINYVQSLQRQVEFLSMKLSTVNPRMDLNMDALLSKDIFQSRGALPHTLYPIDSAMPTFPFGYQHQQVPSLHSGIANGTENQFPVNSLNAALRRNPSAQLPPIDGFGEATPEVSAALWEDDLQSVVQMAFGQNKQQSFHGSMAAAQMKVEL